MLPQFDNHLSTSLFLWAENRILNNTQAYITATTKLYYMPDSSLGSNYYAYSSPFKQWVYDSGVQGATILNSVSGSFGTVNKGESGLKVDYVNGRIIVPSSFGKSLNISGTYSFKELNFYVGSDEQEDILSEYSNGKYVRNPKFNNAANSGVQPYIITTPAIFITKLNGSNKAFELGGTHDAKRNYSLLILAEEPYQVDAITCVIEDAANKSFPLLTIYDDPINEWGDLKFGYDYNNLKSSKGTPGNLVYIEAVNSSKISDNFKGPDSLYLGICDIDLSFARLTS